MPKNHINSESDLLDVSLSLEKICSLGDVASGRGRKKHGGSKTELIYV